MRKSILPEPTVLGTSRLLSPGTALRAHLAATCAADEQRPDVELNLPKPLPRNASDAVSGARGILAIGARAGWGGTVARGLEGATLFLAAGAYLAHVFAHHDGRRALLTRSILVSAFALWGIVQIAPALPGNALLNDVVIVLFVVDLAILVSPWI